MTGNCFIRFVDQGVEDEGQVFQEYWKIAWAIYQTLAFMKYGTLDLDYGSIYYKPYWVNSVLRFGIYMWGQPRRDVQTKPYVLEDVERRRFERFWLAHRTIETMLRDTTKTIRQATELAGDYFVGHNKRLKKEEQLIDIVIALEAMFSPNREGEHRFRIAQRAAILLGKDPSEKRSILKFIRKVYDARSTLVHGGKSPFADGTLNAEELWILGDNVRQAILSLIGLQFNGHTDKQEVATLLDECAFDPELRKQLDKHSNVESVVDKILASQSQEPEKLPHPK